MQDFQCALTDDKHFIIEPIVLTNCGHTVCKRCLSKSKTKLINCRVCNVVTEQDLSKASESKAIKQAIEVFLGNIISVIDEQTTKQLNDLKSIIKSLYSE